MTPDLALPPDHPPLAAGADAADIARLLRDDIAALPRDAAGVPIAPPGWWRQQQQRRPHAFAQDALTMTPAEYAAARRDMRYAGLTASENRAAELNLQRIAARQAARPWRRGVAR